MEAIRANKAPDYTFMGFDPVAWRVTELFLVPGHFMTPTVVERREPLSSDTRRSGWVGSNILLDRIPAVGRIEMVSAGDRIPASVARTEFQQTAFLSNEDADRRDWTTAVMDCIDELPVEPGERFELSDVYAFESRLAELYLDNQHVRVRIRQQLQVLRDDGLVEFFGDGEYRLRWIENRTRPDSEFASVGHSGVAGRRYPGVGHRHLIVHRPSVSIRRSRR